MFQRQLSFDVGAAVWPTCGQLSRQCTRGPSIRQDAFVDVFVELMQHCWRCVVVSADLDGLPYFRTPR